MLITFREMQSLAKDLTSLKQSIKFKFKMSLLLIQPEHAVCTSRNEKSQSRSSSSSSSLNMPKNLAEYLTPLHKISPEKNTVTYQKGDEVGLAT